MSGEFKNQPNKYIAIRQTLPTELKNSPDEISRFKTSTSMNFSLIWSHYLVLMRIENPLERNFYEVEAANQNWSERQLKRQYHSSLYERLALSRNKEEVIKLSNEGQQTHKPQDLLKNPLTLEFLGLDEKASFSESEMEQAIINKLQHFLLELGKGFLFEVRRTLPTDANIYASEYSLYLPEKELLKQKLNEWIKELEE